MIDSIYLQTVHAPFDSGAHQCIAPKLFWGKGCSAKSQRSKQKWDLKVNTAHQEWSLQILVKLNTQNHEIAKNIVKPYKLDRVESNQQFYNKMVNVLMTTNINKVCEGYLSFM